MFYSIGSQIRVKMATLLRRPGVVGWCAIVACTVTFASLAPRLQASIVLPQASCIESLNEDSALASSASTSSSSSQRPVEQPARPDQPQLLHDAFPIGSGGSQTTSTGSSSGGGSGGSFAVASSSIAFFPPSFSQRLSLPPEQSAPEPHPRGLFHPPRAA